jgi:CRP-like cAMP-binding protein
VKKMLAAKTLHNHDRFGHLRELLRSAKHTVKIRKGTFLFQEGMDADELYLILSGKVQMSKICADGKEMCFRICGSGEIIGELTLFTTEPRYLLTAKVMEDGEVAVIKKGDLERELLTNPSLAYEYMQWVSIHARRTQTKFRDLILHGKKGALYSTLIRMCNSYGVTLDNGSILIDLTLKNQDLANFCATTRESVNRMLNALKQQGVLSIKKGKITIHDLDYLKKEIQCENCPAEICRIE